ncbi:MAG: hypothetical protein HOC24_04665 [Deltaproteobacteria bacterium]|nr:hypothetical protein [Deltaproteobacteria bacterium]
MKTTVNLTNAGIGQKHWKTYITYFKKKYENFDVHLTSDTVKSGWFNNLNDFQGNLIKSDPDIIFISEKVLVATIQYKADFSELMKVLEKDIRLIVVSLDLQPLCTTLLNSRALVYIRNIQQGITLEANQLWYQGVNDDTKFELESIPDFTFTQKEYFPMISSCFIPNENIKFVIWKGKTYPLIQFYDFFKEYIFNNVPGRKPIGFTFYDEKCYICMGFLQSEVVKIEYQGVVIDHIIQNSGNIDEKSSQIKYLEGMMRSVINLKMLETVQNAKQTIKQNIPVQIATTSEIVGKVFSEVLKDDGYLKTGVVGIQSTDKDCITINLDGKNCEIIPKKEIKIDVSKISTNNIDNGEFDLFFHSYNIVPDLIIQQTKEIETEKKFIRKKIQVLKDKKKILRSTQVLNHQEQYQNFITQRKLDILISLLESALIWDEKQSKILELSDENALVFYDDHIQGSIINKQLKGIRKNKLFVNITEKLDTLEKIAAVDTDYIEQFLHSGVVVCCKSSQIILDRNFRIFKHKLLQEYDKSSSNQSKKIQAKIDEYHFRMNELSLYELYNQLNQVFKVNKDKIFKTCQNKNKKSLQNKFQKQHIRRISIVSHQKSNAYLTKNFLEEILRSDDNPDTKFQLPWSDLDLVSSLSSEEMAKTILEYPDTREREYVIQQDIANQNAVEIATYFNRLLYQIKVFDPDLVILNHDAELLYVFIKMLRSEYEVLGLKPIIAIVTGEFIGVDIDNLLQQNVSVIASELYETGDIYRLRDSMQTLFFA